MMSDPQVRDVRDRMHASDENDVRLVIPSQPSYLAMARLFAASIARHHGCDEDRVDDVKIAISETVTNAMKAHDRAGIPDAVIVRARRRGTSLVLDVVDRGSGFDVSKEPTPTEQLVDLERGSLGLALVRSLFPSTVVERNADGGMTVGFAVDLSLPTA